MGEARQVAQRQPGDMVLVGRAVRADAGVGHASSLWSLVIGEGVGGPRPSGGLWPAARSRQTGAGPRADRGYVRVDVRGMGVSDEAGSAERRSAGRRHHYPAVRKPHARRHAGDLSLSGERYSHAVWAGAAVMFDFPRESDSHRRHQEPDFGSDDRRHDCGDRQLKGSHPLTGNGMRHALDSSWRPGRRIYLNRRTNRLARYAVRTFVQVIGDDSEVPT